MPRKTKTNSTRTRARPQNRPRRNKRGNEASKPATHPAGRSAIRELATNLPLMTRASKRVMIPYYEQQVARTQGAGLITSYFFTANGLFDPNITGTGHQPMGFDTMMTYYEQYTVMRSKISVTFVNNGANVCRVGISLSPDTTAAVTGDVVENGYVVMKTIDSAAGLSGAGSGTRICELNLNCDCASYFGRKTQREMLDDTSLSGTAAANPSEQVYFNILTWDGYYGTGATTIACDVVLEYDAVFWEPRKVSQQLSREFLSRIKQESKRSVSCERRRL